MLKWLFSCSLVPTILFAQAHYDLFVDPYASPFMGSEWLLTLHRSIEVREDGIFPPKDSPKRGVLPSLGRTMELGLFWNPLNSFTDTLQHEVFGHGYRIRTLKYGEVSGYSFGWPAPYGHGGGATEWSVATSKAKVSELQAINIAGIEAENILARDLKLKWLSEGKVEPRAASLYIHGQLALVSYAYAGKSKDFKEENIFSPNDLFAYLKMLEVIYPEDHLSLKSLRKAALYNLLDPMVYYSLGAQFYYIFTGKSLQIPMITLGEFRWLPNLSVQLAPYGLEYYLENYFLYEERPLYSYLKAGEYSGMKYFGAGLRYDEMVISESFSLGLQLDGWYQPHILAPWTLQQLMEGVKPIGAVRALDKQEWGGAASLVSRWRINETLTFFYAELGYKTEGYLPGYSLKASPIVRLGISAGF